MKRQIGSKQNRDFWWRKPFQWLPLAFLLIMPGMVSPKPVLSAEKLLLLAGPLKLSLSVNSLETFAKTGEIDQELRFYARFAGPEAMAQLRTALQRRFKINHVVVSRITYSPLGEDALERLGEVIQTEAGVNGFHALRGSWILTARDFPEGFTVLDLIRAYPTKGIQINAARLLDIQQLLTAISDYTDAAKVAIDRQAAQEAAGVTADFSRLPDPRKSGAFEVVQQQLQFQRQTQTIEGRATERSFYANLYLPQGKAEPAPVVVVSHGLGSTPAAFGFLGRHLASHGFAVVVPEHVGSGQQQFQSLFTGLSNSNVSLTEFVERPLDVKQVLDRLEELSQGDLKGRLDLNRVGIMGHSFGGYTALVSAGGTLNLERLSLICPRANRLNLSIGLQCLNRVLPQFDVNILKDPRIKAAIAINPLTSLVLGPEGMATIKVPTMVIGSSRDLVTPLVPEQMHPFLWLKTPEKYLGVVVPSGHTAADATGGDTNPLPDSIAATISGPAPVLAREYIRALSLVFMQTYIGDRPEYRTYLNAAYARSISRDPLELKLIQSLTPAQLEQAYGGPPPIPIFPPPLPSAVAGK